MATCLQQITLARAAVTDMTFVFFLTAAVWCYRRWLNYALTAERARWGWAVACGAATGLAMLTKGPVAPVLLSVTFVLHAWWCGGARHLRSLSALTAIITALIVGLPWYIAMYVLHGDEFVQGFLIANNVTRFLKAEHAAQTGHWYSLLLNFPVLLIFFFPWSLFLPQAIARAWRQHARKNRALEISTFDGTARLSGETLGIRLALVWLAVVFVFFSLSKTQLITYIFPLYPAAAILVGTLWQNATGEEFVESANLQRGLRGGMWAVAGFTLVLTIGLQITAHKKYPAVQTQLLVAGLILCVACGGALWLLKRNSANSGAAWTLGTGMTFLAAWLVVALLPAFAPGESARALVRQLPSGAAQIADSGARTPSVSFYLKERPQIRYAGSLETAAAQQVLRQSAPWFIVCKQSNKQELMVPGAGEWTHSGKLVVVGNAAAMKMKN